VPQLTTEFGPRKRSKSSVQSTPTRRPVYGAKGKIGSYSKIRRPIALSTSGVDVSSQEQGIGVGVGVKVSVKPELCDEQT
jgi:hypothetical protein